jgi:FkbM family methyltransferase
MTKQTYQLVQPDALRLKTLSHAVRGIRPAPLASAIGKIFGLSKRKVVSTRHGVFCLNPISDLGYSLMFSDDYEPGMAAVLQRYLSPGGVFIDLGANEGYFSVLASRLVGPRGSVIAVEPQSRLENVIQTNLSLNECSNVRLIQAAVSSISGPVQIQLSPDINTGSSSLFRSTKYPLKVESVPSVTIAELLSRTGVDRCDLIKVDVEGAEYETFMGAEQVLRAGILRNIALEIHNTILETRGLSGLKLHKWILSCGYKLNDELGHWVYTVAGS